MASTILDPEERDRRIKLVGEYYVNTPGASVRSTAQYFTDNHIFAISIATVSDYIKRYMKMMPSDKDKIQAVLDAKAPRTIDNKDVVQRVLKVATLIKNGSTLEEIAQGSEEQYWVLYRDIHYRLPKIHPTLYEEVQLCLYNNSLSNLNNNPRKK